MYDKLKADRRSPWILVVVNLVIILIAVTGIAAYKKDKEKRYQSQIRLAERYLNELDYDKAIAACRVAIEIDPKAVEAYEGLADTYIASGNSEQALVSLKEAYAETSDTLLFNRIEELRSDIEKKDAQITSDAAETGQNSDDEVSESEDHEDQRDSTALEAKEENASVVGEEESIQTREPDVGPDIYVLYDDYINNRIGAKVINSSTIFGMELTAGKQYTLSELTENMTLNVADKVGGGSAGELLSTS